MPSEPPCAAPTAPASSPSASATAPGSARAPPSCPAVTIGAGAIVAAGAVVSSDIPANMVAVGNPARAAKALPPDEEILAALASENAA